MDRAAAWPRAEPESAKKKHNKESRWFLADPSLTGLAGHSARYFQAVAKELKRQKCEVEVLGNRQLPYDLAGKLAVHPVFSLTCDAQPIVFQRGVDRQSAREATSQRHEQAMLKDLRVLNRRHHFSGSDLILFNSLRQWPLRGLVDWLEEFSLAQAPTLVIVLHYTSYPTPAEIGPVATEYKRAFERMATSPLRGKFVLVADSQELQEEFGRISPIHVGLLPIPHCERTRMTANSDNKEVVKFAYLGEARTDKGFHLLPDLVSALESRAARQAQFLIQGYCPNPEDGFAKQARDRLKEFEQVTLVPDALADEEYEALLAEADVILLPYPQRHYHAQTSGILAEAISNGIPAIVPSGTWMATQAQEYGVGLVYEAGNLPSLVGACEQAIETLPELRERSVAAAASWSQIHNASNFVAKLQHYVAQAQL